MAKIQFRKKTEKIDNQLLKSSLPARDKLKRLFKAIKRKYYPGLSQILISGGCKTTTCCQRRAEKPEK
jgi:hypothetical protein